MENGLFLRLTISHCCI